MTELVTLIGAGAITLAGSLFGNNGPSVKVQCIQSYSACVTAGQPEEQCKKILLNVCKGKYSKREELGDIE